MLAHRAPAGLAWTAIAENPKLLELFDVLSLSVDRRGKVRPAREVGSAATTVHMWGHMGRRQWRRIAAAAERGRGRSMEVQGRCEKKRTVQCTRIECSGLRGRNLVLINWNILPAWQVYVSTMEAKNYPITATQW